MLLERLKEYAERVGDSIPPPGYDKTAIKWIIPLNGRGKLLGGLVPTEGRGGRNDRGKEYMAPHRGRTSTAIRPKLLADNGEYVLGVSKGQTSSDKKRKRVTECHGAFVELVRECANQTGEPSVGAVLRFLEAVKSTPNLPRDFDPSHNLTFRVDDVFPIHLPKVQRFWADYFWAAVLAGEGAEEEDEDGESGRKADDPSLRPSVGVMECVVCGRIETVVTRHPFQIKGIPGRRAGAALISANSAAFESYGLRASLIAPTCRDCAEVYVKAANLLIEGRDATSITVGLCSYIFWTKVDCGFSLATLLSSPQAADVKALISSVFVGKRGDTLLDPTPFYAAALTANRSRVVVRDWLETTVAHVKRNLARYFLLQRLVDHRDGMEGTPLGLYALAAPTVRDANRDLPAKVPQALLHSALVGGPLPVWLLFQAVKRNRAEAGQWNDPKRYRYAQARLRQRMALIKMVLLSQPRVSEEDVMANLDPENRHPAYLCGRLLAVLEAIQYQAVRPRATLVDRFYGTASSAPASVFGHLVRGGQNHLAKLRKERPGAHTNLQKRLEEIHDGIEAAKGFPRVLTLVEQGLFGLGYYHQRAADRAAAIAHKQSREEGKSASGANAAE